MASSTMSTPQSLTNATQPYSRDLLILLPATLLTMRSLTWLFPPLEGIPVNLVGCAVLVLLAFLRRPQWRIGNPLVTWSALLLASWLLIGTPLLHDDLPVRRVANLLVLFMIAAVIASGRLDIRSLTTGGIIGYVLALGVSVWMYFFRGSSYEGRLTGILGDPNAAGFILIALGLGFAQGIPKHHARWRWALWALAAGGVWLTQSRTSMFAVLIVTAWILLARHLPRLASFLALLATTWLYSWANDVMEQRGWFQEREGSDNLRERLLIVEQQQVAQAGWTGNGLGTAVADLDSIQLFFHNSYLAMQAEGGRIALYLLFAMMAGLFLVLHKLPADKRPVWAEAGVIAGFICSVNIGFSLTHPAMAVSIGLLLYHHCARREAVAEEQLPAAYADLLGPGRRT